MRTTILRVEKIKFMANIRQAGAHQHRYHKNTPNVDPTRLKLNHQFIGSNNLMADVQKRLDTLSKPPRSNAVLAMDGLLSLSPDLFANRENMKKFASASNQFLKRKFGDNLVSEVLHLDESTPHIHFTVVPIDEKEDGRRVLNARDLFNKIELSKLQKEYFEFMNVTFPQLISPNYGSKAKHTSIKRFYTQIKQMQIDIKNEATLMLNEFKNVEIRRLNQLVVVRVDNHVESLLRSLEGRLGADVEANLKRNALDSVKALIISVNSMLTDNATLKAAESKFHKKVDQMLSRPKPR